MLSGEQWFETLAMAGVPAFLFRHGAEVVHITARTSAFAALDLGFDEATLCRRLHGVIAGTSPESTVQLWGDDGRWHVIALLLPSSSIGGVDGLALVRLPTADQLRDDTFYNVVQNLPDIVARHDRNFRHLYVNSALNRVTSPLTADEFIGKDHSELGMPDHLIEHWQGAYQTVFASGETVEEEFVFPAPDGDRHFLYHVIPEFAADGSVRTVISAARDVSELKQVQQQLEVLARTDPLTSLMNRRSFEERTAAELARVERGAGTLSLLLFDINNFKLINDRFGHQVGDEVLVAIASVLREEIQVNDFAARLGGDEFCIGLVDADPAEIDVICRRIRSRIGDIATVVDEPHRVDVSVGLAHAADDEHSVADLLSRVDELMYREKQGTSPRGQPAGKGNAQST